jgi:hypothetical protein
MRNILTTVLAAIVALAAAPQAMAQASSRAWVSGHGTDAAGCGSPAAPCRSLQYAHDQIIAGGGEIDVLDPAGYGALHITKSVSIVNDGVGTAGVQSASGGAITIDAGPSGQVYLRGLNIDGIDFAGANGIVFNSGASLIISACVVRHFNTNGIVLQPASGASNIVVTGTMVANNSAIGLYFIPPKDAAPTISLAIAHLTATDNGEAGVAIDNSQATGATTVAMSAIDVFHNPTYGVAINAEAAGTSVSIDESHISLNGLYGLFRGGQAIVHLSRSVIDQNQTGILDALVGQAIFSTRDNRVAGNTTFDAPAMQTEAVH